MNQIEINDAYRFLWRAYPSVNLTLTRTERIRMSWNNGDRDDLSRQIVGYCLFFGEVVTGVRR